MRVNDRLVKTVLFVSQGTREKNDRINDYRGTAFIVGVPADDGSGEILHIVTAKHVALAIPSGEAVFAVNGKDGLPRWMMSGETPWFYHPTDSTVDVAIMPLASGMIHAYDYQSIPVSLLASSQHLSAHNIGLGDEIASVGLFRPFHGSESLLEPIVRPGSIAMMPRTRIPSDNFGSIEAFLAEGHSIGGFSGSPVFVRPTVSLNFQTGSQLTNQISGVSGTLLLGLVHGHYNAPMDFSDSSRPIDTGISLIVPAQKILEVLYSPEIVSMREQAQRQWQANDEEQTTL